MLQVHQITQRRGGKVTWFGSCAVNKAIILKGIYTESLPCSTRLLHGEQEYMIPRLAKHTKFDRVCCHKKRLEKTGTGFCKDEVRFRQRTGCGSFKYTFGTFLA